jgi:HNH endonuclease
MIFIKKQDSPPQRFIDATIGLVNYEDLQGENRSIVTDLLLEEQGGLCAICERLKKKFSLTIEHFLPESIFTGLQLNYYNLYVACQVCNGLKANHLIPPYIFDPRFDPFTSIPISKQGIKFMYEMIDGNNCSISVPEAKKQNEHSAYILQSTLDLMQQNRYNENEKRYSESSSLLFQRAAVWNTLMPKLKDISKEGLIAKYQNMKNAQTYPEYVSLVTFLYKKVSQRRGINLE